MADETTKQAVALRYDGKERPMSAAKVKVILLNRFWLWPENQASISIRTQHCWNALAP